MIKNIFEKDFFKNIISLIKKNIPLFKKNISSFITKYIRRPPTTLYKMLFREFFYWLFVAEGMFVIIMFIVDLFQKINDYISHGVTPLYIVLITVLYVAKSISFTIPIAIMFSVAMTLGTFYQNNELVAIYTSGISLFKFSAPVILFNIFLSFTMITFDSYVTIPTERYRKNLFETLTKKNSMGNFDNENITIRGENNYFWNAEKFISSKNILQEVNLFRLDEDYHFLYRLDAKRAIYTIAGWTFYDGVEREWNEDGSLKYEGKFHKKVLGNLKEKPSMFKKVEYDIDNMTIGEAKERIIALTNMNMEHNKELTQYYKKFSTPFTLLIVSLFAIGVATISRTNVLILSLFFSVGLAVLLYVMQMILDVMASTGKIEPILGAWLPMFIFLPISFYLIRQAKT